MRIVSEWGRLLPAIAATALNAEARGAQFDLQGGVTVVAQSADAAGVRSEITASADLFARLPAGSGQWLIYLEGSTTPREGGVSSSFPSANVDAGTALSASGNGRVQVSEFNYTFRWDAGRSLALGLIDPTAWLDRSRITNDENVHFLNGRFVNNPTIGFPDYTLGAVYRTEARDRRPEITVVAAGSDGLADTPGRSYTDQFDLTGSDRGVFLGVGGVWQGDRVTVRFGAWGRTDYAGDDGEGRRQSGRGVYGVLGWTHGPHALDLRLGLSRSLATVADRMMAVAYQRTTRYGLLGAGVARTSTDNPLRPRRSTHAVDAELFFRIPLGRDESHITPSIQYVENLFGSGGTASKGIIAGVRVRHAF